MAATDANTRDALSCAEPESHASASVSSWDVFAAESVRPSAASMPDRGGSAGGGPGPFGGELRIVVSLERREELTQQKQSCPQLKSVKAIIAIAPCFVRRSSVKGGAY